MRTLLFVVAALGCTNDTFDPASHLDQVCLAIGAPLSARLDLPTVEQSATDLPNEALRLDVDTEGMTLNGHSLPSGVMIEDMARVLALNATTKGQSVGPMIVSAPASMPANAVLRPSIRAARESKTSLAGLAFSREEIRLPDTPDEAYRLDLERQLVGRDHAGRSAFLSSELDQLLSACDAPSSWQDEVGRAPWSQKCKTLRDAVVTQARTCRRTNARRAATVAQMMSTPAYAHRPTLVSIDYTSIAKDAPANTSWSDWLTKQATQPN